LNSVLKASGNRIELVKGISEFGGKFGLKRDVRISVKGTTKLPSRRAVARGAMKKRERG